jgi:hypothetical protein
VPGTDTALFGRRYSQIPPEEAKRLAERILKDVPVPSPGFGYVWKIPDEGLNAEAIRVNEKDFVVFAPAKGGSEVRRDDKPYFLNGVLYFTLDLELVNGGKVLRGNIGEPKRQIPEQCVDTEMRRKFSILCKSFPVTTAAAQDNIQENILERGGYSVYVGKEGIRLSRSFSDTIAIFFDQPIENFSFGPPHPLYPISLSTPSTGTGGIVLKVAGKTLLLR